MNTVLTSKTRKVHASVRFGGMGAHANGVLGAVSSGNFYCDNGALKTVCVTPILLDNGGAAYCTLSGLIAIHRLKQYDETEKTYATRFCVMTEAGAVQMQASATGNTYSLLKNGIGMGELTTFVDKNFRYWAGVFGNQSSALIDDKKTLTGISIEKPSGAGCYFRHRLFVAKKPSTVAYSAVDDFTNFTNSLNEGGEISFPTAGGEIMAMRSFKDALYIFFEYGIIKLKVNGLPKEFSAEKIEYRGGKIFGQTVCVGENAILFMASDGVYRLDGRAVKEVCHGLVKLPYAETRAEGAAVWKNKAFIRYQVSDGVYETLCVNEDGEGCSYLDDMQALSQEEGGLAIFRGGVYKILRLSEEGDLFNGKAFLHTCETDFGTPKRKLLTRLKLAGKGSCILTVCSGKKKSRKRLYFQDGYAELRLNARGEKFSFTVEADEFAEIGEMTVDMRVPA